MKWQNLKTAVITVLINPRIQIMFICPLFCPPWRLSVLLQSFGTPWIVSFPLKLRMCKCRRCTQVSTSLYVPGWATVVSFCFVRVTWLIVDV
jgi:hypothetical protein